MNHEGLRAVVGGIVVAMRDSMQCARRAELLKKRKRDSAEPMPVACVDLILVGNTERPCTYCKAMYHALMLQKSIELVQQEEVQKEIERKKVGSYDAKKKVMEAAHEEHDDAGSDSKREPRAGEEKARERAESDR